MSQRAREINSKRREKTGGPDVCPGGDRSTTGILEAPRSEQDANIVAIGTCGGDIELFAVTGAAWTLRPWMTGIA